MRNYSAMGAVGGTVWHGIKGARNSPRGDRLLGSLSAIKARAPVVGGNFGVWGGLFSSFDCAVKGYRQKEDPWNAIISGFLTGGTLAVRSAYRSLRVLAMRILTWSVQVVPRVCSDRPLDAVSSSVFLRVSVFSLDGTVPFLSSLRSQTDPYHPGRLFAESNKPISPLVRRFASFPLDFN